MKRPPFVVEVWNALKLVAGMPLRASWPARCLRRRKGLVARGDVRELAITDGHLHLVGVDLGQGAIAVGVNVLEIRVFHQGLVRRWVDWPVIAW